MQQTHRIAIFASGTGTNARNIITFFECHPYIRVSLVVTNKADAGVLEVAKQARIPSVYISNADINRSEVVLGVLQQYQISFIVLAGFLRLIPPYLVAHYPSHIVNIHPALLPKYGGKGMYGMNVHQAVIQNGETESGITIHYVNEHYDEGNIVMQAHCNVAANDTPETLAKKIHELEYQHYPLAITHILTKS